MNKNLIVISAVWCTSCLIVSNNLKQLTKELGNINIINFDYDFDKDIVTNYNIGNVLPVMILQDENNVEISRLVGEKTTNEIRNFLEGV